jgi:uncharacterized coiled-coil protein SlyX
VNDESDAGKPMSALPRLPNVQNSAVNTLVAIGVSLTLGVLLFLITTTYSALVTRLDRLEMQNASQDQALSAIHVQLDTINSRGTQAADSRLSALESRVTINDARLARLESQNNLHSTSKQPVERDHT